MNVVARSTARAAVAVASRPQVRNFSTPKMHKASAHWNSFKAKRPIDHADEHLVFHTPFNKATVVGLVTAVVGIGWGSMAYGFIHQQYKQGYYK